MARVSDKLPGLSVATKDLLVGVWPWLALIGGLFQLFAAWNLYSWADQTRELANLAEQLNASGAAIEVQHWSIWAIIAFCILVIDAIVLLVAFPKLQTKQKAGWNLLLISAYLSFFYASGSLIFFDNNNTFQSVWSLLVALIIFYLLFQVRGRYETRAKR